MLKGQARSQKVKLAFLFFDLLIKVKKSKLSFRVFDFLTFRLAKNLLFLMIIDCQQVKKSNFAICFFDCLTCPVSFV